VTASPCATLPAGGADVPDVLLAGPGDEALLVSADVAAFGLGVLTVLHGWTPSP
jgi:hypothetical protein